jgi:hypothetical protein
MMMRVAQVQHLDLDAAHRQIQLVVIKDVRHDELGAVGLAAQASAHAGERVVAVSLHVACGVALRDDFRALFLPVVRAEHGVALAVLQHHVFHRLVGDLADFVVQALRQQIVVAGVHHHHALAGDDERQVVVVAGILVGARRGGADRRPHAGDHLARQVVEKRRRRGIDGHDGQAGALPVEEAVAVVLHVPVAQPDQRLGGERAALRHAAIDHDRRGLVRHHRIDLKLQPAAQQVDEARRVDAPAQDRQFHRRAHVDHHGFRARLQLFDETGGVDLRHALHGAVEYRPRRLRQDRRLGNGMHDRRQIPRQRRRRAHQRGDRQAGVSKCIHGCLLLDSQKRTLLPMPPTMLPNIIQSSFGGFTVPARRTTNEVTNEIDARRK